MRTIGAYGHPLPGATYGNRFAQPLSMLSLRILALVVIVCPSAHAVDACSAAALTGTFALLASGTSTISGESKPFVLLSRIAFDGEKEVTGYSSVNFDGLLLGNPVTGHYAVSADCMMSMELQDDSGAFQHFRGKLDSAAGTVELRQTDTGTGAEGSMARVPAVCTATEVQARYTFRISGVTTPFEDGPIHHSFVASGTVHPKSSELVVAQTLRAQEIRGSGNWSADSDCTAQLAFTVFPEGGGSAVTLKLRGVLVDGGRILAIHTEPAFVIGARFRAE